ncbi:MAG: HAMP domain-containing histidine kinase, partial [Turicibacter sp.]|nr:HAMP domain-containing histidine kinase [Turicibacter sp.]
IFAVIGAGAFHWILGIIFKPLDTIATASREIADGQFEKRITIDGQGELASMARDFNQMAETVQQQISFLEEESLQKQAFVDNFAYEIRTPLTSIMGYAQYMQRASMTEDELIDSLGYILDESAYMKDIANSLLDLATLRNFTPVTAKISLKEFSEEVEQGLAASLKEKNVRFSCATDSDFFFGPRDLLKSLAMNLCLNGIKACEPGRGHVFLRISSDFMEVSDNGHGIPAAELKKVTEPFYRVDKDRSRHVGGAGLGLALCQQIATVHGGSLSISSVEGEGTTVMVRLPGGENHA